MKRAYTYFFGGASEAPPSPSTPTTEPEASRAALDTPPKTPAVDTFARQASTAPEVYDDEPLQVQVEKLRAKLEKVEEQLEEANRVVAQQNDTMEVLEKESDDLRAEFQEKEAALVQEKKTLEDHMVSVVVQQVKEAKESERHAVMDECEKEYITKLVRSNFNQVGQAGGQQRRQRYMVSQHNVPFSLSARVIFTDVDTLTLCRMNSTPNTRLLSLQQTLKLSNYKTKSPLSRLT